MNIYKKIYVFFIFIIFILLKYKKVESWEIFLRKKVGEKNNFLI